jgi:hypothetical protein
MFPSMPNHKLSKNNRVLKIRSVDHQIKTSRTNLTVWVYVYMVRTESVAATITKFSVF